MSALDKFHDEAMEVAFFADQERRRGNRERAAELFKQALDLELKALDEITEPVEPTYSILHRSAGWLALDCNRPRLAEQLAGKALAGDPHPKIAEELRDLLEQINFRRHLELKGITLEENEIQLSLSGQSVGLGVMRQDEFFERVDNSSKVFRRIIEWRSNRPFKKRGRPGKDIEENSQLFVSIPRAASFAVTLKLGRPTDQLSPSRLSTDVIDEFMDLMELVSQSRISEIKERIPDPAYFQDFVRLSQKIAPDGERIRQVGFTVLRGGKERFVRVTTPASEFPLMPDTEDLRSVKNENEPVELRGVLCYADATSTGINRIKVIDDRQETHIVEVPKGQVNDIVRPMWNSQVRIKGIRTGKRIILEEIWSDED